MTSPIALAVGRMPLLFVLACGVLTAHALHANDVLSASSDADYQSLLVQSSDASSLTLSSSSASSDDDDDDDDDHHHHDPSYEPNWEDLSDIQDYESSSSSNLSSADYLSESDEHSHPELYDSHDDVYNIHLSHEDDFSSSSVSSVSSASLDDSAQPVTDVATDTTRRGQRKMPASLELNHRAEIGPNRMGQGRPPSVFHGPWGKRGAAPGGRHHQAAGTSTPDGSGDGPDEPDQQPWSQGGPKPAPGGGRGIPSNRPGQRWGGQPSLQRQKELKQADTAYLDLYLCGQFLPGSHDAIAEDFAVATFNYAGRAQPFTPCAALGSTAETVNYVYGVPRHQGASAFQQVVEGIPAAWQRYVAEKGVAPRVVHLFSYTIPSSVADALSLLKLRNRLAFRGARFVLGYVAQPASPTDQNLSPESAQDFIDLLDALEGEGIDTVRVCGRCARIAGTSGRRRAAMRYGMSAVSNAAATAADWQCRPLQEHDIPGAEFVSNACDSFQKSVIRCALRSVQRRCPDVERHANAGIDEALERSVDALTRTCVWDGDCWRREGESIRRYIMPKKDNRCSLSEEGSLGKMLGRCTSAAIGLPFGV